MDLFTQLFGKQNKRLKNDWAKRKSAFDMYDMEDDAIREDDSYWEKHQPNPIEDAVNEIEKSNVGKKARWPWNTLLNNDKL